MVCLLGEEEERILHQEIDPEVELRWIQGMRGELKVVEFWEEGVEEYSDGSPGGGRGDSREHQDNRGVSEVVCHGNEHEHSN